ncbi:MAG: hypothetical protein Q7S13_06945 [Candidatus Omnitrophota bacterium]|nr:hypothetical protein [Candidatus Omnitrophota bacterium]
MGLDHEIHLTERELEEIKDDVAFKTKTTLTLKSVLKKLDDLSGIHDEVMSLKVHRNILWFLISVIITGMFGITFWVMHGKP